MSFQDVVTSTNRNHHQPHYDYDQSPYYSRQQPKQQNYHITYNDNYSGSMYGANTNTMLLSTNSPSYCYYHEPAPPVEADFVDLVDDHTPIVLHEYDDNADDNYHVANATLLQRKRQQLLQQQQQLLQHQHRQQQQQQQQQQQLRYDQLQSRFHRNKNSGNSYVNTISRRGRAHNYPVVVGEVVPVVEGVFAHDEELNDAIEATANAATNSLLYNHRQPCSNKPTATDNLQLVDALCIGNVKDSILKEKDYHYSRIIPSTKKEETVFTSPPPPSPPRHYSNNSITKRKKEDIVSTSTPPPPSPSKRRVPTSKMEEITSPPPPPPPSTRISLQRKKNEIAPTSLPPRPRYRSRYLQELKELEEKNVKNRLESLVDPDDDDGTTECDGTYTDYTEDGGTTDGGTTDCGTTEGGITDGGTTDSGSEDEYDTEDDTIEASTDMSDLSLSMNKKKGSNYYKINPNMLPVLPMKKKGKTITASLMDNDSVNDDDHQNDSFPHHYDSATSAKHKNRGGKRNIVASKRSSGNHESTTSNTSRHKQKEQPSLRQLSHKQQTPETYKNAKNHANTTSRSQRGDHQEIFQPRQLIKKQMARQKKLTQEQQRHEHQRMLLQQQKQYKKYKKLKQKLKDMKRQSGSHSDGGPGTIGAISVSVSSTTAESMEDSGRGTFSDDDIGNRSFDGEPATEQKKTPASSGASSSHDGQLPPNKLPASIRSQSNSNCSNKSNNKFSKLNKQLTHFQKLVAELEDLLKTTNNGNRNSTPETQWRTRILINSAQDADRDIASQIYQYKRTLLMSSSDDSNSNKPQNNVDMVMAKMNKHQLKTEQIACNKLHRDYTRIHDTCTTLLASYEQQQKVDISMLSAKQAATTTDAAIGNQNVVEQEEDDFFLRAMKEREEEMNRINNGMHTVNEIYKELADLVDAQQEKIDTVQDNMEYSKENVKAGFFHFKCAHDRFLCSDEGGRQALYDQVFEETQDYKDDILDDDDINLLDTSENRQSNEQQQARFEKLFSQETFHWTKPFQTFHEDIRKVLNEDIFGFGMDAANSAAIYAKEDMLKPGFACGSGSEEKVNENNDVHISSSLLQCAESSSTRFYDEPGTYHKCVKFKNGRDSLRNWQN